MDFWDRVVVLIAALPAFAGFSYLVTLVVIVLPGICSLQLFKNGRGLINAW